MDEIEYQGEVGEGMAIGKDERIYSGTSESILYAINPIGDIVWTFATDSKITTSPTVGPDGTIYVGANYDFYAINQDGTSATLTNGFKIETMLPLEIQTYKTIPDIIRAESPAKFVLFFENTSNVDIPYLSIQVVFESYAELSVLTDGLLLKTSDLYQDSLGISENDYREDLDTKFIPLIAKDVPPGKMLRCEILARNFISASFPISIYLL